MMNMKEFKNELEKIIYEEFGDVLCEKDRQIEEKYKELESIDKELKSKDRQIDELRLSNSEYRSKIRQLSKMDNLNAP